jgi:hypothetical protein
LGFTFPDRYDIKSHSPKYSRLAFVSSFVCLEFLEPKFSVVSRGCGTDTALVTMPKTTMYENHPASSFVGKIWRARQSFYVSPEPKPQFTHHDRYFLLGLGAMTANSAH